MTVLLLPSAEEDLEQAFNHYLVIRRDLADDIMDEFRRGIELIIKFPGGWQKLKDRHRAYRLNRFPYRIVYHEESESGVIVVSNFVHVHRSPETWHGD